jgi:hypothetical protein
MTQAIYRTWLLPAHRIAAQAILAAYRCPCSKRTHLRRYEQGALL